jgi:hypothetical protein
MLNGAQRNAVERSGVKHLTLSQEQILRLRRAFATLPALLLLRPALSRAKG